MASDHTSSRLQGRFGLHAMLMREWRPARKLPLPWEIAILGALLLLALVLRFATLTHDSLWIDEGYTLASAGQSFQLLFTVPFDTHPALHFAVVKLSTLFLDGAVAVRAPSAVFSVLMLAPIYFLARRLLGPVGALVTVAGLTLSFTMLVYAVNGRNYTQLLLLLMLAAWSLQVMAARFSEGASLFSRSLLGWWGIYTLSALAALYSHNTAVLYLFVLNGVFCAWALGGGPKAAFTATWKLGVVNAPALIIWAPWLSVMVGTSGVFNWLEHQPPTTALITLAATIGPNNVPSLAMGAFFLAVLAGGLLCLVRPGWTLPLIFANAAAFPLFIWLIGFAFKPVYMERIILPAAIGGALALGYLAAHGRRRWLTTGLTAAALLASAGSSASFLMRGDAHSNLGAQLVQDWRGAVTAYDAPGAVLLICDSFTWPAVDFYRSDADVWVHHDGGVWDMTIEDWRANYGQPLAGTDAVERNSYSPWMDGAQIDWPDVVAQAPTMVFLKPNTLCNDGEPEQIRARLAASGYGFIGREVWRNVEAETWRRDLGLSALPGPAPE
ncbi:MAG: glycosyltransferase family 39 protein [Pseudomonadota bacterium]